MKIGPRQYTLAATALGSSLAFIDATALIVALPTMQKTLNLGLNGQQWVFLAYSLSLASLYLIGGAVGDRSGHRRVFIYAVAGFALTSALAGIAPNAVWLIIARFLQGVSGAFITTNSLAWLRSVYGEHSGKAIGLWTSLTGISTIIAPPLGGALTQWFSWRWIFYINLPLAAVVIYWARRSVKDKPKVSKSSPLDFYGSILIAISLASLSYYLVQGAKTGFSQLWWSAAVGLSSLIIFILVEFKVRYPLLPLVLFKVRNFTFSNLETLLIYGALYGVFVYLTFYLQFLGFSPLASSFFLIPVSIILILLATYFGSLADRKGPRFLLTVGPLLISGAALIFSSIQTKNEVWTFGSAGIVLFSIGLAMLVAPITTTALKSLPSKFAGVASGMNNTVSRIGGLLVVAVVGMVISIVFFSSVDNKNAVPLDLHQKAPSHREASQQGYQIGMWIVAAVALTSAAVGWFGISNKQLGES